MESRHSPRLEMLNSTLLLALLLSLVNSWQFAMNPGRFYLAKVTSVTPTVIIIHYYGCRSDDLKKAKFLPGWHFPTQDYIQLSPNKPTRCIRYSGVLDLNAMDTLLVARDLGLTAVSVSTLNSKSRRLLMPVRDELFIYQ
jgi:hypothetical protein